MKKNIKNIQTKKSYTAALFVLFPLTAVAFYTLYIFSAFATSEGFQAVGLNSEYYLFLFAEYAIITLLFIPFILNSKKEPELNLYFLPLMLISALGMMRVDSPERINIAEANHSPSVMLIILFTTLVVMAFSGHTLTGITGTVLGAVYCPAFGICFSPFIAAAAFLFNNEKKQEQLISVIANGIFTIGTFTYGIIKLTPQDIEFRKKYIPVIFLTLAFAAFTLFRKEYKLLPASVLPLFPLISGIVFGSFPTPLFSLSASVAPFVLLLGTAALKGENEKIKGYAKLLSHNPALYIIVAVFILHTVYAVFANPGYLRK